MLFFIYEVHTENDEWALAMFIYIVPTPTAIKM